jgi:hypothetical protein
VHTDDGRAALIQLISARLTPVAEAEVAVRADRRRHNFVRHWTALVTTTAAATDASAASATGASAGLEQTVMHLINREEHYARRAAAVAAAAESYPAHRAAQLAAETAAAEAAAAAEPAAAAEEPLQEPLPEGESPAATSDTPPSFEAEEQRSLTVLSQSYALLRQVVANDFHEATGRLAPLFHSDQHAERAQVGGGARRGLPPTRGIASFWISELESSCSALEAALVRERSIAIAATAPAPEAPPLPLAPAPAAAAPAIAAAAAALAEPAAAAAPAEAMESPAALQGFMQHMLDIGEEGDDEFNAAIAAGEVFHGDDRAADAAAAEQQHQQEVQQQQQQQQQLYDQQYQEAQRLQHAAQQYQHAAQQYQQHDELLQQQQRQRQGLGLGLGLGLLGGLGAVNDMADLHYDAPYRGGHDAAAARAHLQRREMPGEIAMAAAAANVSAQHLEADLVAYLTGELELEGEGDAGLARMLAHLNRGAYMNNNRNNSSSSSSAEPRSTAAQGAMTAVMLGQQWQQEAQQQQQQQQQQMPHEDVWRLWQRAVQMRARGTVPAAATAAQLGWPLNTERATYTGAAAAVAASAAGGSGVTTRAAAAAAAGTGAATATAAAAIGSSGLTAGTAAIQRVREEQNQRILADLARANERAAAGAARQAAAAAAAEAQVEAEAEAAAVVDAMELDGSASAVEHIERTPAELERRGRARVLRRLAAVISAYGHLAAALTDALREGPAGGSNRSSDSIELEKRRL